jgi:hypothetical protein
MSFLCGTPAFCKVWRFRPSVLDEWIQQELTG